MPFAVRSRFDWKLRTRTLPLGERTLIMGIVNVTPDSFSDGGSFVERKRAVAHGLALLDQGADLLDIGGESTRPDSLPIPAEEEQARVLPVIADLLKERPQAVISVDTYHASTARAALAVGVEIINDVSGLLWDEAMAAVVAEARCGLILMHTRGTPREWATQARLPVAEVVPHVLGHLGERLAAADAAGIPRDSIVLDPGFGFGIREEENFALQAGLERLHTLGRPLLTGTSRKGFLRMAANSRLAPGTEASPVVRSAANASSHAAAILAGAHLLRVHDVPEALAASAVADAILRAAGTP